MLVAGYSTIKKMVRQRGEEEQYEQKVIRG